MTTWMRKEIIDRLGKDFLDRLNSGDLNLVIEHPVDLYRQKSEEQEENPIKILHDGEDEEC
ncbi:MAG TPA: hypothetical protein PLP33_27795 [Leptospiraceae bacterium]|nr:hypothetical protein [Leptospiraceae bacterium]